MSTTASIVQLKARLSEYLSRVKAGNEVVVTERGIPVARIVPLDAADRLKTRRQRLARAGLLRLGRGRLRKDLHTAPTGTHSGSELLDALLAERREDDGDPGQKSGKSRDTRGGR
jgi:prevent-host-death family protein